jgi:hypothetical protein
MGHADIQLTLNVYGRLLKDKEAEHAQTADDLALELLLNGGTLGSVRSIIQ